MPKLMDENDQRVGDDHFAPDGSRRYVEDAKIVVVSPDRLLVRLLLLERDWLSQALLCADHCGEPSLAAHSETLENCTIDLHELIDDVFDLPSKRSA